MTSVTEIIGGLIGDLDTGFLAHMFTNLFTMATMDIIIITLLITIQAIDIMVITAIEITPTEGEIIPVVILEDTQL